jgi:hypothetical protein
VDGDGWEDVLVGGESFGPPASPGDEFRPVRLYRNQSGASFADITERLVGTPMALASLDGAPQGFMPLTRFADFNGDGKPDLVVFFWGYQTRALDSAYLGRPPLLYLSSPSPSTDLTYSSSLGDAVLSLRETLVPAPRPCGVPYETGFGCDVFSSSDDAISALGVTGAELHAKAFDVGDIDGDGDLDITVETGGGFGTSFYLVTFINDGSGNFSAHINRFAETALKGPPTAGTGLTCTFPNSSHGTWRHKAHRLIDINGDGSLDMVMGALRNVRTNFNCDHINLQSKIFLNNGSGHFTAAPTSLPSPPVYQPNVPVAESARTFAAEAIAFGDLIGDPQPELVIVYTRSTNADSLDATSWTATGRYIQLLQRRSGSWEDVSVQYFGSQSTTLTSVYPRAMHPDPTLSAMLTRNNGEVARVRMVDINGDSRPDLVLSGFSAVISEFAPMIYLNESTRFRPFNPPSVLAHPFASLTGLMTGLSDVNRDGRIDWLFAGPLNGLTATGSIGTFLASP